MSTDHAGVTQNSKKIKIKRNIPFSSATCLKGLSRKEPLNQFIKWEITRQKETKKCSLHVVNEHVEFLFNTVRTTLGTDSGVLLLIDIKEN